MVWGYAEIPKRPEMVFRRISGISLPAVAGVLLRQIHHQAITPDLRHNRGGSDRGTAGIAAHYGLGSDRKAARDAVSVDQEMVGRLSETGDGTAHGKMARLEDVQRVDLCDARLGDGYVGHGQDLLVERRAPGRAKLLRIAEAGRYSCRIEPHGSRHDRTAERAAADLIHPSHAGTSACKGGVFEGKIR